MLKPPHRLFDLVAFLLFSVCLLLLHDVVCFFAVCFCLPSGMVTRGFAAVVVINVYLCLYKKKERDRSLIKQTLYRVGDA